MNSLDPSIIPNLVALSVISSETRWHEVSVLCCTLNQDVYNDNGYGVKLSTFQLHRYVVVASYCCSSGGLNMNLGYLLIRS